MNAGFGPLSRTDPAALREHLRVRVQGCVTAVIGLVVEGTCAQASVGHLVEIRTAHGELPAEVIGLRDGKVLAIPLGDVRGIGIGDAIVADREDANVERRLCRGDLLHDGVQACIAGAEMHCCRHATCMARGRQSRSGRRRPRLGPQPTERKQPSQPSER